MSKEHFDRVRGAGAMVLERLTGAGQLRRAVRRHQDGDTTASDAAPESVIEVLSGDRLPWVQFPPAVLRRLNCPRFKPNLFALIVPEDAAIAFLEAADGWPEVGAALVDIRSSGKAGLTGQELALIIYADTPPIGYAPNTPVAVFTLGMSDGRQKTLCDAVLAASGLKHGAFRHFPQTDVYLYLTDADLPIAQPPPLTDAEKQSWRADHLK